MSDSRAEQRRPALSLSLLTYEQAVSDSADILVPSILYRRPHHRGAIASSLYPLMDEGGGGGRRKRAGNREKIKTRPSRAIKFSTRGEIAGLRILGLKGTRGEGRGEGDRRGSRLFSKREK